MFKGPKCTLQMEITFRTHTCNPSSQFAMNVACVMFGSFVLTKVNMAWYLFCSAISIYLCMTCRAARFCSFVFICNCNSNCLLLSSSISILASQDLLRENKKNTTTKCYPSEHWTQDRNLCYFLLNPGRILPALICSELQPIQCQFWKNSAILWQKMTLLL